MTITNGTLHWFGELVGGRITRRRRRRRRVWMHIPHRNAVPPPQLPRDAPVLDPLEPVPVDLHRPSHTRSATPRSQAKPETHELLV
eukprot:3964082-Pyramimonas_sp.AAC.2